MELLKVDKNYLFYFLSNKKINIRISFLNSDAIKLKFAEAKKKLVRPLEEH
jgi:hypothetical protein